MKTVTLLCRGESLKHVNKLSKPNQCVLVNAFHYELEHKPVHDYVSKCDTVTHVLSVAAYFPASGANKIYKNYNFDKIIVPYVKEVAPHIPNAIQNIEGSNGILPVEYLDDINKKDMISHPRYAFTSPTCGLDALLYCVNQLRPDTINIIGLDFYDDSGYFTNSHGRKEDEATRDHAIRWGEPTDKMQEFFVNVVEANKDIQFNLYTKSEIVNNYLNNLKIERV
jgi:hypothetical protein|tara:strand:- start:1193 stop:1864 length:672 start_codon:yes stop_codon:yes gene_type:complete